MARSYHFPRVASARAGVVLPVLCWAPPAAFVRLASEPRVPALFGEYAKAGAEHKRPRLRVVGVAPLFRERLARAVCLSMAEG